MDWARILAYVIGLVDQELLARTEYLAAENRILKAQLKGRLKLSDAEHHPGLPPDEATPDGNNSLYCFNFLTQRRPTVDATRVCFTADHLGHCRWRRATRTHGNSAAPSGQPS